MGKYTDEMKESARLTNEKLASQISKLKQFTTDDIDSLFPQQVDKENLQKLLDIMNEATDENEKIIKLKMNIEKLAGTAVKLIKFFV
jgi:CRISPR/Cas system-associated protein Cas5 (RAMP superfamily)